LGRFAKLLHHHIYRWWLLIDDSWQGGDRCSWNWPLGLFPQWRFSDPFIPPPSFFV
jgi:hypothetical protein